MSKNTKKRGRVDYQNQTQSIKIQKKEFLFETLKSTKKKEKEKRFIIKLAVQI